MANENAPRMSINHFVTHVRETIAALGWDDVTVEVVPDSRDPSGWAIRYLSPDPKKLESLSAAIEEGESQEDGEGRD